MIVRGLFIVVLIGLNSTVFAQESLLEQLQNGERDAVEAIALYPEKEREAILEASLYPEVLVRMQNLRRQTEAEFKTILSVLSEEHQKKLMDLTRYPDLVDEICAGGKKKSNLEIEAIISDYPEELQNNVKEINRKCFDQLQQVYNLYTKAQDSFEELISNYPSKTQDAYRELLNLPEVVSTLNEYMGVTVLLGDIYKNNSVELKRELDSLNVMAAEDKARELNEWQKSLEEDPAALAEYEQATQEFANEQGYSTADYNNNVVQNTTEIYVYHSWQPYPYWFGPPSWYYYDYWYPYPWWYHSGYYYGPGNVIVFVGMPSYYFMYWHMYHHHHHHFYHYPHFTSHAINYYYGHRKAVNSVSMVTQEWIVHYESEFPKGSLSKKSGRVEMIKEYGKLMMDYEASKNVNTGKFITKKTYLEQHAKEYPNISPVLKEKENPIYGKIEGPENKPDTQPVYKDKVPVKEKPVQNQPTKVQENPSKPQKVDRAKDYHYEHWKKNNPPQKTNPNSPQNKPQQNPPTRTQPKKEIPVQKPKTNPVKKPPVKRK